MEDAIHGGQLSGNGIYTERCQAYFRNEFNFKTCLLTHSCTSALEMAALLAKIEPGDEVIVPSYTYVSTANPFVMRGAEIVFADSESATPNIDVSKLSDLITERTKAIVVVHYAGIACDMDAIMALANAHNVLVIEDAAHAQGASYKGRYLGGIGHLGAYSFHATKNITSGEGGLLIVNDDRFAERAEMLWEKGTNRKKFLEGVVTKYEWCDIGSSFYPSEITAAFLWAQLEISADIQQKRMDDWNKYYEALKGLTQIEIPNIPEYASHNAHLFYLKAGSREERDSLMAELRNRGIGAAFHYLALHTSPYWKDRNSEHLPQAKQWEERLLRLPLYHTLSQEELDKTITAVTEILGA